MEERNGKTSSNMERSSGSWMQGWVSNPPPLRLARVIRYSYLPDGTAYLMRGIGMGGALEGFNMRDFPCFQASRANFCYGWKEGRGMKKAADTF
jgi:hypothetical protein